MATVTNNHVDGGAAAATAAAATGATTQQQPAQMSRNELERVTEVFKFYETGVRDAAMYPKVRILELMRPFFFCVSQMLNYQQPTPPPSVQYDYICRA